MATTEPPAVKSYFFGKGYNDLYATIIDSWDRNIASAADFWKNGIDALSNDLPERFVAAVHFAAAVSVVAFGTLFFLVFSAIHIVILLTFFLVIYVLFTLVWIVDRSISAVRHYAFACPYCHTRSRLPVYVCPSCKRNHPRLEPSSFGIVRHRCRCGERLAATFLLGRGKLTSQCPRCGQYLNRAHTESHKLYFAVIGGPSVGKSAYLFALIRKLVETEGPRHGADVEFESSSADRLYQHVIDGMDVGKPPHKTIEILPRAIDLKVLRKGKLRRLVYFYDPAGEAFDQVDDLAPHHFYRYLTGAIVLVDPFCLPGLIKSLGSAFRVRSAMIRPGRVPPHESLGRLINALEAHFHMGTSRKLSVPVAVVINKIDELDLTKRLSPPSGVDTQTHIRETMADWGARHFINVLDTRFETVRFFRVSSLGRSVEPTNRAFNPSHVLEPFTWLLQKTDKAFWP